MLVNYLTSSKILMKKMCHNLMRGPTITFHQMWCFIRSYIQHRFLVLNFRINSMFLLLQPINIVKSMLT